MIVFSGKSTIELRNMNGNSWKKEGTFIEMDDTITSINSSKDGLFLLVNISMSNPRIELISFESTPN